jgi:hypothetical protein
MGDAFLSISLSEKLGMAIGGLHILSAWVASLNPPYVGEDGAIGLFRSIYHYA